LLRTRSEGWTILVRLMVGLVVFLPEGIQKLVFPEILGAGRFANIGIPYPEVMGPFVGTVEVVCGTLIILGLLTRLAAIPLIVVMVVAIVSTKLPIWAGHDIWIFHMPKLARYGFWSMAHEARDDFLMLPRIDLSPDRGCRRMVSGRHTRTRTQPFISARGVKLS
jgi:putative oxidoreductase